MPPPSADAADYAACGKLLRTGSHSFHAASLLLPARIRHPATALYAFCRVADDAIDLGCNPQAALANLQNRLDAAYAGTPHDNPIDRAFAATIAAHRIPKTLPAALIEGLAWDAEARRYETFADLLDYAARVAGAVGVMMAMVMGVRDAASLARAADLGTAMQLTNIARDVGEDAAAGRLYLPTGWLAQAGINGEDFLRHPHFTLALGGVVKHLLEEAALLYQRAGTGIARLPLACRAGIGAAARIYAAIGNNIAAHDYNSVDRRAHVTGRQKYALAAQAAAAACTRPAADPAPALPANLFLLAGAEDPPATASSFTNLITMFERLERAQHTRPQRSPA